MYVAQPEVKPGCVLRQSNVSVLEKRKLVNDKEVPCFPLPNVTQLVPGLTLSVKVVVVSQLNMQQSAMQIQQATKCRIMEWFLVTVALFIV